ncbi:MAG TPA: aminotransferase class IV [bacterium]|nr:aminotransferase class IV [bacterium]
MIPERRASVPVSDSSYLYGIGLFETLRAAGGRVLFFPLHDARLRKNARRIGLKMPLSPRRFLGAIAGLLRRNRLKDATVRVMLSETSEGKPRVVITAKPFKPYPARCYREGARVVFARSFLADSKSLAPIKTTSYLSRMIPRREAARRGADEALLLSESGLVTEAASSNVFIVKNGVLFTPPLIDGLLAGTRRKVVMELAKKLKIPVRERSLRPKDLFGAHEAFLTSTLKDVMPVGWVEGKKIGVGAPGPVTRRLLGAFQTLARM